MEQHAYLFEKDGCFSHLIPDEATWQINPTSDDMNLVRKLGKEHLQDSTNKTLGYRDVIKAFKLVAPTFRWNEGGITSFILRMAVTEAFNQDEASPLNQVMIERSLKTLNDWITLGFIIDPYTKERITIKSNPCDFDNFLQALLL